MDNQIMWQVSLTSSKAAPTAPKTSFAGTVRDSSAPNMNKLWFKSEGFVEHGVMTDGDTEALYDRPISFLRYFDAQAGVRYDLDSNPGRTWGAIGVEGLAPYFFELEPTFYFSDHSRFAGKISASYDILITQRLIAQPQSRAEFLQQT